MLGVNGRDREDMRGAEALSHSTPRLAGGAIRRGNISNDPETTQCFPFKTLIPHTQLTHRQSAKVKRYRHFRLSDRFSPRP